MEEARSDVVIGVMMTIFGLVGLWLASGALDVEMSIFGLSLAGFACLFVLGLVRRHFDRAEALRMAVEAPHE